MSTSKEMDHALHVVCGALPISYMLNQGVRVTQTRGLRYPSTVPSSGGSPGSAGSPHLANSLAASQRRTRPIGSITCLQAYWNYDRRKASSWRVPVASYVDSNAKRGGGRACGHGLGCRSDLCHLPKAVGGGAGGAGGSGSSQGRIASEVRTPNGSIKWGCYLSRRSTLEVRHIMSAGRMYPAGGYGANVVETRPRT